MLSRLPTENREAKVTVFAAQRADDFACQRTGYPRSPAEIGADGHAADATELLDGSVIDVQDLELHVIGETVDVPEQPEPGGITASKEGTAFTAPPEGPDGDLDGYLAGIERGIIETALNQHRWNRTAAAKSLGITLRSLRYRLKKLGIED